MNTHQKLSGIVVSVLNMKGGVGKTTISGNTFREIFRGFGKRTLLIDFDAQINLTQLLLKRATYQSVQAKHRTLWHVMEPPSPTDVFTVSESDQTDCGKISDYIYPLRQLAKTPSITLDLLPGDFQVAKFNLRESPQGLKVPRLRFQDFVTKARSEYDVVVLDCNPSSSFMTRSAIENSTHILVPVRPDKYSVLGLEMIGEYITQLATVKKTPEIIVVLNGTGRYPSSEEAQVRSHPKYGPATLASTLPQSGIFSAKSDYTGFAVDRRVAHHKRAMQRIEALASELAKKLELTP